MSDLDDNFIYFLVAGLIIIAVLLVVFNSVNFSSSPNNITFVEPVSIINISGSVFVGMAEKDAFQSYVFDIAARDTRSNIVKDFGNIDVYNGLLFGEQTFRYRVSAGRMESLKINFEVFGTNEYGLLVIKVNGIEIYKNNTVPGEYQIYAPALLLADNALVEISTTSSQWKIWAPSIYHLGINMDANGFEQNSGEYKFIILDEFSALSDGKLNLAFDEAVGNADIYLNNHRIHSGPLRDIQSFNIDKSILEIGENTFSFIPYQDSTFSGRANLALFFKVPEERMMRIPLNFTIRDVENLPGTISFDIVDLQKQGAVSVKIYSRNELVFSDFAKAEKAHYVFTFTGAKSGLNILFIQSMDGAAFLVNNVDVRV